MKMVMKLILISLTPLFLVQAMAKEAPVIGKFNIESATCEGEQFLWKKHDQMIISQKVIALEGPLLEKSSSEKLCRFQDVYRINGHSSFESKARNILCWPLEAGVKSGQAEVAVEEIVPQELEVSPRKTTHGARVKLSGMELCPGELELELSYPIQ